jgi:phosphate transport system substrate-binding protein
MIKLKNKKYKYIVGGLLSLGIVGGVLLSCHKTDKDGNVIVPETMTSGKITMLVDESVAQVVDDVLDVFHYTYANAHITQVNVTENEIVKALLTDSVKTAVLCRPLTEKEENHFRNKGVTPEVTFIATDALAVITAGKPADSTLTVEEIIRVIKGQPSQKIKRLVLDNPNSGTVQYLLREAGVDKLPVNNVVYQKNSVEVITFVNNNPGSIGIVGVNWLLQPTPQLEKIVENLTVLGLDNVKIDKGVKKFYTPTQSNIGAGFYPLTRKIYVLNYQGYKGLGIGFANYSRADKGQRIILKSGLLPMELPTREIQVNTEDF